MDFPHKELMPAHGNLAISNSGMVSSSSPSRDNVKNRLKQAILLTDDTRLGSACIITKDNRGPPFNLYQSIEPAAMAHASDHTVLEFTSLEKKNGNPPPGAFNDGFESTFPFSSPVNKLLYDEATAINSPFPQEPIPGFRTAADIKAAASMAPRKTCTEDELMSACSSLGLSDNPFSQPVSRKFVKYFPLRNDENARPIREWLKCWFEGRKMSREVVKEYTAAIGKLRLNELQLSSWPVSGFERALRAIGLEEVVVTNLAKDVILVRSMEPEVAKGYGLDAKSRGGKVTRKHSRKDARSALSKGRHAARRSPDAAGAAKKPKGISKKGTGNGKTVHKRRKRDDKLSRRAKAAKRGQQTEADEDVVMG